MVWKGFTDVSEVSTDFIMRNRPENDVLKSEDNRPDDGGSTHS
jgi:hypothetical protein